MILRLAGATVIMLGGLGLLVLAAKGAGHAFAFRRTSNRVIGRVRSHVPAPSDEDGLPMFSLDVEFEHRGRQYACRSDWSESRPRKIGRPCVVLVPHGRPREARLGTIWESWGETLIFGVMGAATLAFGVLLIVSAL